VRRTSGVSVKPDSSRNTKWPRRRRAAATEAS
jgi:hypothetical protein